MVRSMICMSGQPGKTGKLYQFRSLTTAFSASIMKYFKQLTVKLSLAGCWVEKHCVKCLDEAIKTFLYGYLAFANRHFDLIFPLVFFCNSKKVTNRLFVTEKGHHRSLEYAYRSGDIFHPVSRNTDVGWANPTIQKEGRYSFFSPSECFFKSFCCFTF